MSDGDASGLLATTGRRPGDALGDTFSWFCGAALALNLLLAAGIVVLIGRHGLAYFWQRPVVLLELTDGTRVLGEVRDRENVPAEHGGGRRVQVKIGNRDFYGMDFRWIDESRIRKWSQPRDAVLLERQEWGNFYGHVVEVRRQDGEVLASGRDQAWQMLVRLQPERRRQWRDMVAFEKGPIGDVNAEIEALRIRMSALERRADAGEDVVAERQRVEHELRVHEAEYRRLAGELEALRARVLAEEVVLEEIGGHRKSIPIAYVVRPVQPNALSTLGRLRLYLSRVWEFLSDEPRESNTEGGIFPALFGTVLMVFLMSVVVAPFGVLAALYLREYARQGWAVRLVRIAVNNLAGVPSIVFGVFGLGFFVYGIGGFIDRLFYADALPTPTFGTGGILWASLTLALLTVPVVIVATEEGLAAVPRAIREGSYALGATRFETTWRVVLPAAAPGILTGLILAMARAAGEVAPLMIVGMVKLAPALPLDHRFPYLHLERKFMHLGFHIYDVGFQSPNVEAAKPAVFATALLLVLAVVVMNLTAIVVRERLRRRLATSGL